MKPIVFTGELRITSTMYLNSSDGSSEINDLGLHLYDRKGMGVTKKLLDDWVRQVPSDGKFKVSIELVSTDG